MWMSELFSGESVAQAMVVIGMVAACGLAIGSIRVCGISLGVAGVLFSGLAFGHFGFRISPEVLEFAREFGLILFVYTIGVQVGPGFFESFKRHGLPLNLMALATVVIGALLTMLLAAHSSSPEDFPLAVGVFSGATTNTPSLAAVQQALRDIPGVASSQLRLPGLGYALAYPFGIVGVILVMLLVRLVFRIRIPQEIAQLEALHRVEQGTISKVNVEVSNPNVDGRKLCEIPTLSESGVAISRVMHAGCRPEAAHTDTVIRMGDVLLAVGPEDKLAQLVMIIGSESKSNLMEIESSVVYRDVLVTASSALGRTLGELDLRRRFGVTTTRIRRTDVELPSRPNVKLQFGDAIRLVGEDADIRAAARELGNSMKQLNYPRLIPVFLGIVLGIMLGSLPINIPGMPSAVRLGLAGGPLIAAIILSRVGHIGPLVWHMPVNANFMMREIGIVMFLACVGLKAGDQFVEVLIHGQGLYWLGCGAIITVLPLIIVACVARLVFKLNYLYLCGLISGSMTDPPALAFASSITGSDEPSVSYSTVYPMTMLLRVLCAQIMVIVFFS